MNIDIIKNEYLDNPDLNITKINKTYLVYLESICDSDKINNYILNNYNNSKFNFLKNITGPNNKVIKKDEYQKYLNNGFILIITNKTIHAIEVKANNHRSITTPETQISYNGPKDSFNENYQSNLGLIKKRIKSSHLKCLEYELGKYTKTKTGILYIDNICLEKNVLKIKETISKIDIDGIIDSSDISEYLEENEPVSFSPTSFKTERPDYVCSALLEGKIVIIVDNSPNMLILPAFLIDFINPPLDKYNKTILVNAIKIMRILAFIITLTLPAFYIALTNYNQEAIPTNILLNLSNARRGVPFPSIIEAIIMLFIYEILRESDIHFPKNFGSANSILGALILGEASVKAGIVSPIMIIIIAITFISSLVFSDLDFINAIRHYRFLYLIAGSCLGLFGMLLITIYFFSRIAAISSIDYPFSIPISPIDKQYFNKIYKIPIFKQHKRSHNLSDNTIKEVS